MPEIVTLRCDWPKCQKVGIRYRLSSDAGDRRRTILCPEHAEPVVQMFKYGEADDDSRQVRRPKVDSKEGLLSMLAPDEQ